MVLQNGSLAELLEDSAVLTRRLLDDARVRDREDNAVEAVHDGVPEREGEPAPRFSAPGRDAEAEHPSRSFGRFQASLVDLAPHGVDRRSRRLRDNPLLIPLEHRPEVFRRVFGPLSAGVSGSKCLSVSRKSASTSAEKTIRRKSSI